MDTWESDASDADAIRSHHSVIAEPLATPAVRGGSAGSDTSEDDRQHKEQPAVAAEAGALRASGAGEVLLDCSAEVPGLQECPAADQ